MSPQPRHNATTPNAGQPAKPLQGEYGSGGSYGVGGGFKDDEPGSVVEEGDDSDAQDPDAQRPPVPDVHTRESESPPPSRR